MCSSDLKSIPELQVGNISLNRKANSVKINQEEIKLSKPEFELLFFFAQNPRKIISQENLLCNIWGSEIYLFDTSVDVYIQNLRMKIGVDLIQNYEGQRYRFDVR